MRESSCKGIKPPFFVHKNKEILDILRKGKRERTKKEGGESQFFASFISFFNKVDPDPHRTRMKTQQDHPFRL